MVTEPSRYDPYQWLLRQPSYDCISTICVLSGHTHVSCLTPRNHVHAVRQHLPNIFPLHMRGDGKHALEGELGEAAHALRHTHVARQLLVHGDGHQVRHLRREDQGFEGSASRVIYTRLASQSATCSMHAEALVQGRQWSQAPEKPPASVKGNQCSCVTDQLPVLKHMHSRQILRPGGKT